MNSKTCPVCGKTFGCSDSPGSRRCWAFRKYCSNTCCIAANARPLADPGPMICAVCEQPIVRRKGQLVRAWKNMVVCSRECRSKRNALAQNMRRYRECGTHKTEPDPSPSEIQGMAATIRSERDE